MNNSTYLLYNFNMNIPNNNPENKDIYHLTIPIKVDYEECLNKIYPNRRPPDDILLKKTIDEAENVVKPRSVYRIACVESLEPTELTIKGVRFTSSFLPKIPYKNCSVFPFILTLGQGWDNSTSAASDSLLEQFYLDQIGNILLRKCSIFLESYLKNLYKIKRLSSISPGSLTDWPIEEQKPLFSLFGNNQNSIDVILTPQMLMIPKKSISGIFFPSQEKFIACSLCSRKDCSERSVPFKC